MGIVVSNEDGLVVNNFYRGETAWHSDWKKAFPENCREVTFSDIRNSEYHRADVHTACQTTIEFQNSPINLLELQSREAFYPNLIWVVNGKKFKGFKILKHLPDVDDEKLNNYEFCHRSNLTMIRKADVMAGLEKPKILNFRHPELQSIPFTTHYYSFQWRFPHRVWYDAKCPLVFDFGGHFLYQLKQRPQINGNYAYLHMITRKSFIERFVK